MSSSAINATPIKVNLSRSTSPFSLKEKVLRFSWNLCWLMVSYLPKHASFIRVILLRLFGAKVGKRCLIESGVKIWIPHKLELHDYVAIGRNTEIYNYATVRIESMTVVSQYCYLCTGSHDYTDAFMPLIWAPIMIGSECWISAGVWILPGVSIGSGTVIGARSLITKEMPSWSICAGSPCKFVKKRVINKNIINYTN